MFRVRHKVIPSPERLALVDRDRSLWCVWENKAQLQVVNAQLWHDGFKVVSVRAQSMKEDHRALCGLLWFNNDGL